MEQRKSTREKKLGWFQLFINRSYLAKWAVIGILIGIVAGFGATAFYYMIQIVNNTILGGITGFFPPNPAGEPGAVPSIASPRYYLIPVSTMIGGAIAGLIIYKFAPEAEGHGTDAAIDAFHNKNGVIRKRVPLIKTIASAFTIGTGGSAGREGPTAQIAAGFGSIVGDFFDLSAKDKRTAVACGIGAGIGSIFKSPFGGAILAGEILYSGPDIEAESLIPGFIASPVGYIIFGSFTKFTPIFGSVASYTFTDPSTLVIYAFLGILCAGFGRLYSFSFYGLKRAFDSLRVTNYVKPMIGATIAGTVAIFFPQVTGLGYGFVQLLINNSDNFANITTNYFALSSVTMVLLLIVIMKIFATSITVGSGGSGGVFAPALVIGGFLGAFMWELSKIITPGLFPTAAPLVIIGMMALFGGVGRVPIAVILMVTEMTGSLALVAPAMVAVVISYFLVGPKYTIYHNQVPSRADSPAHRGEYNIPVMSTLKVRDAMHKDLITLTQDDSADAAFALMSEKKFRGIPIITRDNQVIGIVTMNDILRIPSERLKETSLKDVMTKNVVMAFPDETLLEALGKLTTAGVGRLPVVDGQTRQLVGILTRTDLFKAYRDRIQT
jgi:CIC family chloride channel protein